MFKVLLGLILALLFACVFRLVYRAGQRNVLERMQAQSKEVNVPRPDEIKGDETVS